MLPAGHLQGRGWPGAGFAELLHFINSDLRPAQDSSWDADTATVRVPPHTAVVYVLPRPIPALPYSDASHRR